MPKLTEIRLVTDNGRQTMEKVFLQFFKPLHREFPTVKSLYVRTTIHMADTFRCFPNLEAVNFNIHGSTSEGTTRPFSVELYILCEAWALPRLRTLAILKTAYGGWTADDISCMYSFLLTQSTTCRAPTNLRPPTSHPHQDPPHRAPLPRRQHRHRHLLGRRPGKQPAPKTTPTTPSPFTTNNTHQPNSRTASQTSSAGTATSATSP